jgi:hypothetical protein
LLQFAVLQHASVPEDTHAVLAEPVAVIAAPGVEPENTILQNSFALLVVTVKLPDTPTVAPTKQEAGTGLPPLVCEAASTFVQ